MIQTQYREQPGAITDFSTLFEVSRTYPYALFKNCQNNHQAAINLSYAIPKAFPGHDQQNTLIALLKIISLSLSNELKTPLANIFMLTESIHKKCQHYLAQQHQTTIVDLLEHINQNVKYIGNCIKMLLHNQQRDLHTPHYLNILPIKEAVQSAIDECVFL